MKRLLLWVVLPLVLLYTVAGFWLLPHLAERKLPPLLSDTLGTPVTMGSISFNPFTMELTIPDLAISDGNGSDLLRLGSIEIDPDPLDSLLTFTVQIGTLRLKNPQLTLVIHRDGRFNFSPILEHLGQRRTPKRRPQKIPDGEPPKIHLGQFAIEGARVRFRDERPSSAVELEAAHLDFGIEHLRTFPSHSGVMAFKIETARGARIRSYTSLSLDPLRLDGNLSIDRLALAPFTPYLQQSTRLRLTEGDGALALDYRLYDRNGTLSAEIDNGRLHLDTVRVRDESSQPLSIDRFRVEGAALRWPKRHLLVDRVTLDGSNLSIFRDEKGVLSFQRWLRHEPGERKRDGKESTGNGSGDKPWRIDISTVTLTGLHTRFETPLYRLDADHTHRIEDLRFDTDGTLRLTLRSLALEAVSLTDRKRQETPLGIARVALTEGVLRLPERRVDIDALLLEAPRVSATLFKSGETNLQRLFLSETSAPKESPPAKTDTNGRPLLVTLKRFDLGGGSFRFEDRTGAEPVRLSLQKIALGVKDFSYPQQEAAPFRFTLKMPERGTLRGEGHLLLDPLRTDAKLELADVALSPYLPYLQRFVNLDIPSGTLGLEATLSYDTKRTPRAIVDYSLALDRVRVDHALKKEKIATFKRIVLSPAHLQLMPAKMKIDTLRIVEPYVRVDIAEDRSTNLDGIVKERESDRKEPPKGSKSAQEEEPFRVSITDLKIEKGSSDFSDLSLPLPFRTHIHDLDGDALGIGNLPESEARIALKGIVERYGMAKIDASMITRNPLERSRVDVDFRNLPMRNLSPYTGKYIGYAIREGRLWLKLRYLIDDGRLKSDNKIVLKRLELGEKIESNESINAPIHLALALLKDSNGVIDLDIPVEGNVTDPQFRISKVVWQAIGNMITGIVTAPFRFLGSILGIEGEELQYLSFEPGSGVIDPTEREKLDKIAEAFAKRPLLALKIGGVYHPVADREAIAEAKLRALLAERVGKRRLEAIGEEATVQLLESLYRERAGAKALETLKSTFEAELRERGEREDARGYLQTLRTALKANFEVKAAELEGLAQTRARHVADYLAGRGVGPERLEIEKGGAVGSLTETGLVPMKLDLGAQQEDAKE